MNAQAESISLLTEKEWRVGLQHVDEWRLDGNDCRDNTTWANEVELRNTRKYNSNEVVTGN